MRWTDLMDSTWGLRVILLVCGLVLILLLVWLDRRRRQAASQAATAVEVQSAAGHEPPSLREESVAERDSSAHRPLPVIDWNALERDGGTAGEDEPRLAVHSMSPEPVAREGQDAEDPLEESADVAATEVFVGSPTIDHWPPEDERRICSLRIAPPAGERFAGRVLRQALQGAGFVHGVLGIFHHPDLQGRALISAANLARPGQLDPTVMDFQRFGGLHVFTVLPGPVPDRQLLEQLFLIAGELAERVSGHVQDERGAPLTAVRRRELLYQYAAVPLSTDGAPQA